MEPSQLFKRLYSMTINDLATFIDFEEKVDVALMKLDLAARTRHIIEAIQLEDMWQSLHKESNLYKIYLSVRLSPMTLCSVLDSEQEMNSLEWRIIFPKYSDIEEGQKPKCFGEYMEKMNKMDIIDINEYDIDEACLFLDKAYDFSSLVDQPNSAM
jgi:hypothetical protein